MSPLDTLIKPTKIETPKHKPKTQTGGGKGGPPSEPLIATGGPLGEPGDECQSCKAFHEAHDQPPRKLIALPGKFTDFGIPVLICPWCDGPLAERFGLK